MIQKFLIVLTILFSFSCNHIKENQGKFVNTSEHLEMGEFFLRDSLRIISIDSLSDRNPSNQSILQGATPFTKKLWKVALADIESNIVETENGRYFGAGKDFGMMIFTRDISFAGILGVNQLYPEEILSSIKVTRDVRLNLGFSVPKGYVVSDLQVDWVELDMTENEFVKKYHTNNYLRRTDDVVWMWAISDLFKKHPKLADWKWFYETGVKCFGTLYDPFLDLNDGLYRGQSAFIDVHFVDRKTTGYPQDFSIGDCVMLKALSTNCIYYKGMLAMADASSRLGYEIEANEWQTRALKLKEAIVKEFSRKDGTLAYFKDKTGKVEDRREALGTALAVITEVVEGEKAQKTMSGYDPTWHGVPLFKPFYPWEGYYHNNTSWPFVDTFFLWAKEIVDNEDYTSLNAGLLARTCIGSGSFHEVTHWSTREPYGSGSQLWSAAAFVNVCYRAGLVNVTH